MAHVVFSGLESPKEEIGIAVPHFESKAEIEKYIKEQKVGASSYRKFSSNWATHYIVDQKYFKNSEKSG